MCVRLLLLAASVVPSSPILVTLMKEALSSSETSVITRTTQRNIPEDTILYVRLPASAANFWSLESDLLRVVPQINSQLHQN
jgi:hypothetical protein